MIFLYNHESFTWSLCMQETLQVESEACRRTGRRTRATNIPGRNVSRAPRNIQMAAMDSPVFDYVVFYFLLNNMYGAQWSQGLPRYLNPCTNWLPDSWSCSTLKLNTSSAWCIIFFSLLAENSCFLSKQKRSIRNLKKDNKLGNLVFIISRLI